MAAAPFKATLIFARGSVNGPTSAYYCTVSDVNAAQYIFPDGQGVLTLPQTPCYLKDVILSAAGTDTTTATIYANGKPTGDVVVNAANVATVVSRQFQNAPLGFVPGAQVRFTQVT